MTDRIRLKLIDPHIKDAILVTHNPAMASLPLWRLCRNTTKLSFWISRRLWREMTNYGTAYTARRERGRKWEDTTHGIRSEDYICRWQTLRPG